LTVFPRGLTLGPVRYGFIIDQTSCIGCHACTVACKSENEVPLGTFRTWVKYVEKGEFPDTRRHFAVLRCNQCEDAPCMAICPTKALFRREDGIVDFDSSACIGCKSCMQACPYDALYIDPLSNTAAKCNYCAHRVDKGLEPACAVVCPTQAIIPGDLDDPTSRIAQMLEKNSVEVRKPDKGTKPKVFYIGAEPTLLDPRIPRDSSPMFTDPGKLKTEPADIGTTREVYDIAHEEPWGWKVWAYLWTKSIAAGVGILAAFLTLFSGEGSGWAPPALALLFLTITAGLLIFDLKHPERFWYMLVRPNFSSWLVLGGMVLTAFGGLAGFWLLFEYMGRETHPAILWAVIPVGGLTAGYTAFLFHQAKGRDFWQSPGLLVHLLLEAVVCGAAGLILLDAVGFYNEPGLILEVILGISALLQWLVIRYELDPKHEKVDFRNAAKEILSGRFSRSFLWYVSGCGTLLPLVLLGTVFFVKGAPGWLPIIASVLVLCGALEYGRIWIRAGQSGKLS
jgi:Fe-S-cluster-containing dehydrogenase component/formate-dependent nitrite reductase membrane component NrfD